MNNCSGRALALAALTTVILLGCREFSPNGPFPCSTAGRCPIGYTCDKVANLCQANGHKPDGSSGDGAVPVDGDKKVRDAEGDIPVTIDMRIDGPADLPALDLPADAVRTPNGGACTQAIECQSTICVDGICCDKACQGTCQACKQADTGQATGTCAFVSSGRDPHDQCTQTAAEKCGDNGSCDGAGACQKYGSNQICAVASCSGSIFTPAGTCNGMGTCATGTPVNCMQYPCSATGGCAKTCTGDGDCLGQSYCSNGACQPKKPNGDSCQSAVQCSSNNCIDGICCDKSCGGQCEACDVPGFAGTCVAVKGPPHRAAQPVRAGCGGDPACPGQCDGSNRQKCAFPVNRCRPPSCRNGAQVNAATCDLNGACPAETTTGCPFLCINASGMCGGICNPAMKRCFSNAIQTCSTDGLGWSDTETCALGCSGTTCNRRPNGGACSNDSSCASGHCIGTVCCATACGTCNECSTGTCRPVAAGWTPDCQMPNVCDGKGSCFKDFGARCTTHSECIFGFCQPPSSAGANDSVCAHCGDMNELCCPAATGMVPCIGGRTCRPCASDVCGPDSTILLCEE